MRRRGKNRMRINEKEDKKGRQNYEKKRKDRMRINTKDDKPK